MRTVADIKNEMATAFMANENLARIYGFPLGDPFERHFSKVSIENLIMYVVAFAIYTLEKLFDAHTTEMQQLLQTKQPHNSKWYHQKALAFQYGRPLLPDSDTYDTIVDDEMIVKHAAVVEFQGKLFIKVAKGDTVKEPLSPAELNALAFYFSNIKDAGVKLEVISLPADHIAITMNIYYDPMVLSESGISLASGKNLVRDTILHYVEHEIPFNGQFRTIDIINTLQATPGVVIPELVAASTVSHQDYLVDPDNAPWIAIKAYHNPVAGYYKIYSDDDLILNYIPYKSIEDV